MVFNLYSESSCHPISLAGTEFLKVDFPVLNAFFSHPREAQDLEIGYMGTS